MSETLHEYKQVEGGDKCSVCGDGRLSHFFAPQPTTTPPQSEERPKKDVAFVSYITAKIPSHPDTLREIEEILDSCVHNYDGVDVDEAAPKILSLIAQEKERWESELSKELEKLEKKVDILLGLTNQRKE